MHARFSDSRFGISDLASSFAPVVQSQIRFSAILISFMIYRRVLRYYRPFLGATLLGLALLAHRRSASILLKPWPFKFIVDQILPSDSAFRLRHADWRRYIPLLCLALGRSQVVWGILNFAHKLHLREGRPAGAAQTAHRSLLLSAIGSRSSFTMRAARLIPAFAWPTIRRPSRRSTTRDSPTFSARSSRSSACSSSCCNSTGSSPCFR